MDSAASVTQPSDSADNKQTPTKEAKCSPVTGTAQCSSASASDRSSAAPTRYQTLVADPPWHYDGKTWASITHGGKGARIEKAMPYSTLSEEEIASLPLSAFAAPDCRLFLWATSRHLPVAFRLLGRWGFDYAQTLVWQKTGNPSPFSGGGVAPQHAEFLLVAKRGQPDLLGRLPSSVIAAPKPIYGHSQKPEVFMDLVEQVSPGPYLEMFSRRARLGWDTWGDEALHGTELIA